MTINQAIADIRKWHTEHGKFPKVSELSRLWKTKDYRVSYILKELSEHGHLTRRGNWYFLPEYVPAEIAKEPEVVEETAPAIPEESAPLPVQEAVPVNDPTPPKKPSFFQKAFQKSTKTRPETSFNAAAIISLRVLMGMIGVGALILSAYYTAEWTKDFLVDWLAYLLAGIVVGFAAIEFLVQLVLRQQGDRSWRLHFLLLVVALGYSIFSTIAGQYDKIREFDVAAARKEAALAPYFAEKAKIESELLAEQESAVRATKQIDIYMNVLSTSTSLEDSATWRTTLARTQAVLAEKEGDLKRAQQAQQALRADLVALLQKVPEISRKASDDVPDIYSWLAEILHVSRAIAQFLITLFPSVFIDLIAPAALSVALFLKDRRKVPTIEA